MLNNTIARDEVAQLDSDLREIYSDYGTQKLVLLKHSHVDDMVDDVYEQYIQGASYVPYPVLGMVLIEHTEDSVATNLGDKQHKNTYKVKVLKSSVTQHGLQDITSRDKLKYGEQELTIISVRPQPIIGDYCVQYSILARGDMLDWEEHS